MLLFGVGEAWSCVNQTMNQWMSESIDLKSTRIECAKRVASMRRRRWRVGMQAREIRGGMLRGDAMGVIWMAEPC